MAAHAVLFPLFFEIESCDNPINCLSKQTRHLIGWLSRWSLIKLRSKTRFSLTFALVNNIDTFRQQGSTTVLSLADRCLQVLQLPASQKTLPLRDFLQRFGIFF